ncbi:hypothetical protein C0431_12315 [bacterium]|nr:hypothetical protein [bacterium]
MEQSWKDYEKERYEAMLSGLEYKQEVGEFTEAGIIEEVNLGDIIESDQVRNDTGTVEQGMISLLRNLERILTPRIENVGNGALSEILEQSRILDEIEKEADRMLLTNGKARKAIAQDHAPTWANLERGETLLEKERETGRALSPVEIQDGLVIPAFSSPNIADARNGAKIKVTRRVGLSSQAQRLPLENVIDGSNQTYWEETILADDSISRQGMSEWDDIYPGLPKEGAFIEMEISFRTGTLVSEVDITPFCRFPIEVVSIVGMSDKEEHVLVKPSEARSSSERMTFRFPGRDLTGIRILCRQRNAEERHYWVSTKDNKEQAIWDHQASLVLPTSESLTIGQDGGNGDALSKWYGYLRKLKALGEMNRDMHLLEEAKIALELASIGDYDKSKELYARYLEGDRELAEERLGDVYTAKTKLAYRYGFSSIEVRGVRRAKAGVAVSKRMSLPATTRDIVLVTEETHMSRARSALRGTSVEWSISSTPSPEEKDWRAILPQGDSHVIQEQLVGGQLAPVPPFGADMLFFRLRFNVQDGLMLYKDGIRVEQSWYGIADDKRTLAMKRGLYSPTSVYTVDYRPSPDSSIVRLSEVGEEIPHVDKDGSAGERYEKVPERKTIELVAAPIAESVRVHVGGEQWSKVDEKPGDKEFRLNGQVIEFGDGDGEVKIDYDRFATSIRVKAVLRQHQGGVSTETPSVLGYTLYTADEKETEHGQIQGTFNAPY